MGKGIHKTIRTKAFYRSKSKVQRDNAEVLRELFREDGKKDEKA